MRSSLPVARPAADLSQPYAPPVGLSLAPPAAQGSEASPAARTTLDSERIPRASKLLICGLFQKGRVLAQDGIAASDLPVSPGHPFYTRLNALLDADGFDAFVANACRSFYAPDLEETDPQSGGG